MVVIRDLAPEVIAQIAAGEVVTRAGDVVKELLENAVDAVLGFGGDVSTGPRGTIAVEIVDGGHSRIQVADDGCGIPEDDLPAAVRRHATSKITQADDLHALQWLGFRGEALAAICAVSDLTLVSAVEGAPTGALLEVIDGTPSSPRFQARRRGTTVAVARLFERVPARRKFQRAASSETAHIGQLVQAYALAYPEIAFSLTCDGRAVLRTPGTGDLRDAAAAVLGPEAGRELLTLRDEREVADDSSALLGISGLIAPPSLHRATRNGLFLTVNRRPIDSRALVYALEEAYATLLPVGRHPLAVVDLAVPAGEIDANVHPTKREVRLLRERLAFGVLQQCVRATLVQTIGIPHLGETRGQLAGDQFPESDGASLEMFARPAAEFDGLEARGRPQLGALRILGQVALTYIICEGRAGLYLVDQHAAHERVMLERLEHDLGRDDRVQLLLEPVAVTLPPSMRRLIDGYVEELRRLGFDAEGFGDAEVVVRSVPSALRSRDIERVLCETHETLEAEGVGPDWRERLAVLMSCKSAVKAGQRLEVAEMQSLLEQLDEATLCGTCSHGRPTAILLSHSQLEREFGRR